MLPCVTPETGTQKPADGRNPVPRTGLHPAPPGDRHRTAQSRRRELPPGLEGLPARVPPSAAKLKCQRRGQRGGTLGVSPTTAKAGTSLQTCSAPLPPCVVLLPAPQSAPPARLVSFLRRPTHMLRSQEPRQRRGSVPGPGRWFLQWVLKTARGPRPSAGLLCGSRRCLGSSRAPSGEARSPRARAGLVVPLPCSQPNSLPATGHPV